MSCTTFAYMHTYTHRIPDSPNEIDRDVEELATTPSLIPLEDVRLYHNYIPFSFPLIECALDYILSCMHINYNYIAGVRQEFRIPNCIMCLQRCLCQKKRQGKVPL